MAGRTIHAKRGENARSEAAEYGRHGSDTNKHGRKSRADWKRIARRAERRAARSTDQQE